LLLLGALLAGLAAALLRARLTGNAFRLSEARATWLVVVAFIPQWLTFYWGPTRRLASETTAAIVLVTSQTLLLFFAWRNRNQGAFRWLGLGLLLNWLVICLNGGLMPISPETVSRLAPEVDASKIELGVRLGGSKDIVLPEAEMYLPWLADRMLTPAWWPQRAAFSVGDIFVAIGAFWWFWQAGGRASSPDHSP
jgi:hypothetical protein